MQLLIQNRGEAPIEAFTLLGASMSREDGCLIGQFGSGAKLAITTLLRRGRKVTIYSGLTRMEFKTKPITIKDDLSEKQEEQVYVQFGGTSKKKQDLGWVLGMGQMDWEGNVDMALREFVANAIDQTIKQGSKVLDAYTDRDLIIDMVPDKDMRAQKGYTRVFIDSEPALVEYVGEVPNRFLHFTSKDYSKNILPKGDKPKAQIYYNGVFVRELTNSPDSIFDYNFTGNQISIDESRNLDEYQARAAIGRLYRDAEVDDLAKVFRTMLDGVTCLENTLDHYYLKPVLGASDKQKETWRAAWERVNGDSVACTTTDRVVGEYARKKGHTLSLVESEMMGVLQAYDIPTVNNVLSEAERKGRTITPPTFEAIDALNTVWEWVAATDLVDTEKCPRPQLRGFDEITEAESDTLGYYNDGVVYIRNDVGGHLLLETALEEVAHYVTGAMDRSVDLQNFAFRLIVRWLA